MQPLDITQLPCNAPQVLSDLIKSINEVLIVDKYGLIDLLWKHGFNRCLSTHLESWCMCW